MDDRGFIFTADASLALIVIMIVTASITSYLMAPYFMGQDHEHLQALASDTLETMEQDGTLSMAAVKYSQGDTAGGDQILDARLSLLIPTDTGYNMTMYGHSVGNDSRTLVATDTATAVRVISGPKEGYMGRAWYKQEEVIFEDQQVNVTRTVWNFHNWLTNFYPWSGGLHSNPYWGYGSSAQSISFSLPDDAVIHGAYFLQGSANQSARRSTDTSYGVTVNVNGMNYMNTTPFTTLYERSNNYGWVYNYKGNITNLQAGSNSFYVHFDNLTGYWSYGRFYTYSYNMPWFSILANYTTTMQVPEGILNLQDTAFPDAAGLAVYIDSNHANITTYDLSTGTTNNYVANRVMNWNTYVNNRNYLDNYDDGVPFVIDNGYGDRGSAVSVVKEFNIPDGVRIFDGYVDVNAYGATDNAIVEVWDGTEWRAVFCSFDFKETPSSTYSTDYSAGDGYGNTPGTIYIGDKLHTGDNKVRITVWDNVPSTDYDLVGLVDSSVHASYSYLPINWVNYAFNSYQASDSDYQNTYTFPNSQGRSFTIGEDATKAYLFVGVGTTSTHLKVEVSKNQYWGWQTLYDDDAIPYSLDLGYLDASLNKHVFTSGPGSNYTLTQGNYWVRVTVTSPESWKSGDGASNPRKYGNPTIFSGTRVAVLYPKFLQNYWATSYNSTAEAAKEQAKDELIDMLEQSGIHLTEEQKAAIQTEALYTGNLPNAISARLDLWK